ncbi:MAG: polysaccharide biosynthesis C-terminal domain-containing protein [Oscillospiraceae bacterium]|nr:polysaccharide biosynthesis C-terminal domain-containing protein [Oscillospiraceae bacterium]
MKKQTFIFSSAILIFSAIATKLIGALFRIPLANMLGGTGMGYFSSAYGIFMTVYALSVTGLPTAVARVVAENSALAQYANIRKIKSASLVFFGITGFSFTLLLLAAAYPFCILTSGTETVPSVLMIAPSVFFCCVTSVYRGYYEGLRNMFPTAVSQVIEGLFKLCAGLAFCMYVLNNPEKFDSISTLFGCGTTAVAAAAAVLGITLSSAAGMLFLIIRDKLFGDGITYSSTTSESTESTRAIIGKLLKIALPVAAGALVTNLTSLIDLVTVTRSLKKAVNDAPELFSSISDSCPVSELHNFMFGSFTGLAVTVFNLIPSFTNMFGKGIFPSLSEAFTANDQKAVALNTEKALLSTAIIAVPSGFGIMVLAEKILGFLFSAKSLEVSVCAASMSILGTAVIFLCISSTIFSVFQALGKPQLPVKIMLCGVAVKLIGNLILVPVPQLNIAGAALSTLLCYVVIFIPSVYYMIKLTKISARKLFGDFCKLCYCSVMCAVSAKLTENILSNALNTSFVLFISIFIGVIIYIFCGFLLGIFTKSTLKLLIS